MSSSSERSGSPSQSASVGSESDSGSDSSDEFFDAEEPTGTLLRFSKKAFECPRQRIDLSTLTPAEIDSSSDIFFSPANNVSGGGTLLASHNNSNASVTSLPRTEKEIEEYAEEERRMKKMEEMRRRLNTEEVEDLHPDETSPSDSQTSSIEGLYGATSGRTSHPFKVVDHDTVSMQSGVSVGRMGRISANPPSMSSSSMSSNATSTSTNSSSLATNTQSTSTPINSQQVQQASGNTTSNENNDPTIYTNNKPDLVASCLSTNKNELSEDNSSNKTPVAPPRRKRKGLLSAHSEESLKTEVINEPSNNTNANRVPLVGEVLQKIVENAPETSSVSPQHRRTATVSAQHQKRYDSSSSVNSSGSSQNPPSPTVSIRSVCKDLDKTLEMTTSQKFWVVKAQDEEKTRAKNSGPKVLRRTESLPKDVIAAFDPSGSGSGGCSNSNSSSLNTIIMVADGQSTTDTGSVGTTTTSAGSFPIAKGHQISTMISALAALEEQKEKDAADAQVNIVLRTRTDSGKLLSDLEILEQVTVLNLDTGERIPLSSAEDKIPQCINPLSLHIMRLTSEYVGDSLLLLSKKDRDSDEESIDSKKSSAASQEDGESTGLGVRKKTAQIRRFLGSTVKKTVDKAKSLAHHRHAKEDVDISTNEDITVGGQDPLVKMKASHSHKGPYDFDHLQQVQDLMGEHNGPVWCMKFSNDGRLLATAGQDRIIRIWVLKDHLPYFQDMRSKHTVDKVSPTPSQESIVSQHSHHSVEEMMQACENSDPKSPFVPRPLCIYSGHTADLLDIAWSKSFFLLSSSMDRTVRLWHISRRECLCCFQHIDFVTAIAFHPRDDRYFLSGSLDGKLRLWNIPDKKVALWNEVNGPNNLITTANFCQNGKFAVVGTYDGRCIFFHTEQLKYHTQIIVHRRKRLTGRKITGIEPMPGEDKILVTSNDSRIRLYDLRDLSLTCKYKGYTNSSSQIKGTVSHDGKYIVSGSENQCVYIWKTCHDYSKFSSARRDRNGYWEGIKAHNAVVTCAIFAPDPDIIVKQIEAKEKEAEQQQRSTVKSPSLTKSQSHSQSHSSVCPLGYVLVSADFSGCIKVFLSKVKPKHSSLPASALA